MYLRRRRGIDIRFVFLHFLYLVLNLPLRFSFMLLSSLALSFRILFSENVSYSCTFYLVILFEDTRRLLERREWLGVK